MGLHSLNFGQPAHSLRNLGFSMEFVGKMTLQSSSFKNILILRVLVHKGFDGNQRTGETQLIFVLNRDYGFLFEYLLERLVARLVFCWSSATLLRLKKRQFGVKIPARGIETFRRVELFSQSF